VKPFSSCINKPLSAEKKVGKKYPYKLKKKNLTCTEKNVGSFVLAKKHDCSNSWHYWQIAAFFLITKTNWKNIFPEKLHLFPP